MQVSVGIFGHVVVEYDVDSLDVHASSEQVGGNQYAAFEVLLKFIFYIRFSFTLARLYGYY